MLDRSKPPIGDNKDRRRIRPQRWRQRQADGILLARWVEVPPPVLDLLLRARLITEDELATRWKLDEAVTQFLHHLATQRARTASPARADEIMKRVVREFQDANGIPVTVLVAFVRKYAIAAEVQIPWRGLSDRILAVAEREGAQFQDDWRKRPRR